jgi:hypothetical protein
MEINNLEKIRKHRKEKYDQMNKLVSYWFFKSLGGAKSKCIKSFCAECLGYTSSREEIEDCRGYGCPLYFNRPYQYNDTQEIKALIENEEKELPVIKKYLEQEGGSNWNPDKKP